MQAKIHSLYIYPVKSLAGVKVLSADAKSSGLEFDRQWGIFRDDRHPLTQRKNPRMALIQPEVADAKLILTANETGKICIKESDFDTNEVNETPFSVWSDQCYALPQLIPEKAKEVSEWLSVTLHEKQKLSFLQIDKTRPRKFVNPERFNNIQASNFSDAAPYLVANIASLEALNKASESQGLSQVDIRHFRPNIVLEGIEAFDEHQYTSLTLDKDDIGFHLVDHCQRCVMITVDPDRGEYLKKAHPFATLAKLNSMPDKPKAPAFGVNATLKQPPTSEKEIQFQLHTGQTLQLN